MYWELTGDRGDKWLSGILPTWSLTPYKVMFTFYCSILVKLLW